MEQIIIFDTTLRDGEQSAGASMTIEEKIMIAKHLEILGVDVIEAGFAASSIAEFEAITKISQVCQNAIICSLSRARKEDILASFNAVKYANKKRIHTFISTSEIHIKHKLNKTHEEVLEMIKSSVAYAKSLTEDIEWSAEDATRTNFDFLCLAVEIAIQNGANTINIPDTVGYTTPQEYYDLIKKLTVQFKGVIFSAHCHNDLGLAVANSLAAINGGARQIECTINGLGERAGNAALEEIIMAIKTRNDVMQYITNVDTKQIFKTSALVSNVTGFLLQKNKAIVGSNAFSHASGIHQDGMIKNSQTYEIIKPEDIGCPKNNLVLGKLSGKAALNEKIKELGFMVSVQELEALFTKFKKLCDAKKNIYDEDILSLISFQSDNYEQSAVLWYKVNHYDADIEMEISVKIEGKIIIEKLKDNCGILDSGFKCINKILNINPKLEEYEVKAVTSESDSQGFANIVINDNGKKLIGKSCNVDVILASLDAYLNACLKI